MHIFESISQVREKTEKFMDDYNTKHPNDSLGNLSPIEFNRVKYFEKMTNLFS